MRIRERYDLAVELGWSYQNARRKERSRILDAYCLATAYSRKHGLRVLRGTQQRRRFRVRGVRRRRYGLEFQNALKVLWEASGYVCAERLQPFLRPLASLLARHGQLELTPELEQQLQMVSASTVERNLRHLRRKRRDLFDRSRMSQTKPGTLLRHEVPVVVGQWKELDRPGYLEVDSVAHCGESLLGVWISTISATDLSTGWTERVPVLGRNQELVVAAMERVLAAGVADLTKVKSLVELYSSLSPLTLKRQIDVRLAAMPLSRRLAANA